MAPRSFWKGYLKLSLVSCPVAMMPATTEAEKLRFHTLNRETGNRVVSRYVDAVTGKPVAEDEEVRGYERGEGDHILLEDEELEAVALDSVRTIDIDMFVPRDAIDWVWLDAPHFLTPDDPVGEEAFAVIREAMATTGTVGIARLVLYRRERAVMLEPRDRGIVLWTLRYGEEVRDADARFESIGPHAPAADLLELTGELIDKRTKGVPGELLEDPVQARLAELVAARQKGRKPPKARAEKSSEGGNVVNIMDALKRSIASEKGSAKR